MQEVILVGAGGHAAELRDYINDYNCANQIELGLKVVGYLDDNEENYRHYAFDEAYLGNIFNHQVRKDVFYLMAIANLTYRKSIISNFEAKS
jgi:acetyltransferase EpsM